MTTYNDRPEDWTYLSAGEYPCRMRLLGWQRRGLTWTASGYGPKIPSSRQLFVAGRWRRVYVAQYSNAGTAYVIVNGARRLVHASQFAEVQS